MPVVVDRGRARTPIEEEACRGEPPDLAGDRERSSRLPILTRALRPPRGAPRAFLVAAEGGETHRSHAEGVSSVGIRAGREELFRHFSMALLAGEHERRRSCGPRSSIWVPARSFCRTASSRPGKRLREGSSVGSFFGRARESGQHSGAVILARTPSEVLLAEAVAPHHGVESPLIHPGPARRRRPSLAEGQHALQVVLSKAEESSSRASARGRSM
jgi:hypothetical protein